MTTQRTDIQTVRLGMTGLAVTPIAYGTWQFGGDWGPVDEQVAVRAIVGARTPAHLAETLGALELTLTQDDLAGIDKIMAAAVPFGGPSPEGMTT